MFTERFSQVAHGHFQSMMLIREASECDASDQIFLILNPILIFFERQIHHDCEWLNPKDLGVLF